MFQVEEASQEQARWLGSAQEKMAWCSDLTGDKYSIEAKLATVQELLGSVEQGKQRTGVMAERISVLQAASPRDRHSQLEQKKRLGQESWESFVEQLNMTRYLLSEAR